MEEVEEKEQAERTAGNVAHEPAPAEAEAVVTEARSEEALTSDEIVDSDDIIIAEAVSEPPPPAEDGAASIKAIIEAAIYITDEPLSAEQIAAAIDQPIDGVKAILAQLVTEYAAPDRGLSIREIAGGYKMSTKPEHHEAIRRFVRGLQAPLKLSLAALETLAVIAYRQPITAPEVLEVRGVQGAGVLKTLLDRKLIAGAGRKNVLGKPMMYKTTREFLVQFGLNSLADLPTLKEFEELGRLALSDAELPATEESVPASIDSAEHTATVEKTESAPETAGEHQEQPAASDAGNTPDA